MRNLNYSIFIILISLIVSCTSVFNKKAPHKFINERKLASEDPQLFLTLRRKARSCYDNYQKSCRRKNPYHLVKRKWTEFEYQKLNRQNILQAKYNECIMRSSVYCSEIHGLYEDAQRMEDLRIRSNNLKSIQDSKNNTLWNSLKDTFRIELPTSTIRKVYGFLKTIKQAYFFLVDKVIKTSNAFSKKAFNALHSLGVGASANAMIGVGGTLHYEAVMHNRKLALFCAPGVFVKSDIGISAEVAVLKTISCKDNADYAGKFLTFDLGVSFEYAGLPASAGGSYSVGMDVSGFLKNMRDHKYKGNFNFKEMVRELDDYAAHSPTIVLELMKSKETYLASLILMKLVSDMFSSPENSKSYNIQIKEFWEKEFEGSPWKMNSLGAHLSTVSKRLAEISLERGWKTPQFTLIMQELSKAISSCDAIAAGVGLSATLSPVSVGVILYQYQMVTEVNMDDVLFLWGFIPKNLSRLSLPKSERDKFVKSFTNVLKVIPDFVNSRCIYEAGTKFKRDFDNAAEILKD